MRVQRDFASEQVFREAGCVKATPTFEAMEAAI